MSFYLPNDVELDSSYDPNCGRQLPTTVKSILLTGANGFLGCHILSKLLDISQAKLFCLVRGETHEDATRKLTSALLAYQLHIDWDRVVVVKGDIAEHQLGIDAEEYLFLCKNVDVLLHNAADVRVFSEYDAVHAANIGGLRSALKLAVTDKLKYVTFISSYSVFNADAYCDVGIVKEQSLAGDGTGLRFGYAQSKWVGELICENARLRGIPVTIIRPPYVVGNSITSAVNKTGLIESILCSVILSNSAPDFSLLLHSIPVNLCADLVAEIALKNLIEPYIYHLIPFSPITWSQLIDAARNNGYEITLLPPEEWRNYLQKYFFNQSSVISTIEILHQYTSKKSWGNSNIFRISFDCQNLGGLFSASNFSSQLDVQYINHYLQAIEKAELQK